MNIHKLAARRGMEFHIMAYENIKFGLFDPIILTIWVPSAGVSRLRDAGT
jgi:hypothetical protein